jgi:hypothetical protein
MYIGFPFMAVCYQLRRVITALLETSDSGQLVQLEPGQVARLRGPVRDSGLVEVDVDGQTFTLFFSDLQDRAELIQGQAAGRET